MNTLPASLVPGQSVGKAMPELRGCLSMWAGSRHATLKADHAVACKLLVKETFVILVKFFDSFCSLEKCMCPDLTLQTLLIDANSTDELQWVFQGSPAQVPQATDLNDLAVEVDWTKKRTVWMLYGACHADTLDEVLSLVTECSKVVVLEASHPDSYHLTAPDRERLRQHLLQERLSIIVGGSLEQRVNKLLERIDINKMDGWKPLLSQAQMNLRPEDTRALFSRLAAGINMKVLNKNTHLVVSLPYLRNALINAPLANQVARLKDWKQSRKDRPVLVVSAGPSLNKQLALLTEHQDLFTILAVDTVWPILQKHGIVPDAILAIDRISRPSWPRNGVSEDTAFCVDLGCAPRLVWSNDHNHVFLSCKPDIYDLLKDMGAQAEVLRTGGSVATSAFQLAEELGGNPIVFIGQDLALTDGRDHADGYLHVYQPERLAKISEDGFDVAGYYGGQVRTERQLLFYKTWFEGRIKALPERLIINATEGGACIAGAAQLPFATVCQEIRSTSMRKTPLMGFQPERIDPEHMENLCESLDKLKERVSEFGEIARRGREICKRTGSKPSKKQLARIDKINLELRSHEKNSTMVVDVMCMAQLEAIRYKAHIGEDMEKMSDVVKEYDRVYANLESGTAVALLTLDKVQAFYNILKERGEIDPELAQSIFPI
jgi:hypothetical protein